jgi:hypothetical protein
MRLSAEQAERTNVQRNLDLYALWKMAPGFQLRIAGSNLLGQDNVRENTYAGARGLLLNRFVNVNYASVRLALESRF